MLLLLRRAVLFLVLAVPFIWALTASADYPADVVVGRTRAHPTFERAVVALDEGYTSFVDDIVRLTEIPAPPFGEEARGEAFQQLLLEAGLADVERDDEGNVMGLWRGGGGPLLVVSAHLDTVFPAGTDLSVNRSGTRLAAPGIGDDSHGLAVLLTMVRAMAHAGVQTSGDILFVGTVGEEGAGSLRGVRYLFERGPYRDRIGTFISIDGAGPGTAIANGAVGSERYRVTFSGPGGHSYGGFGLVNPAYALANAVREVAALPVRGGQKTTFNVGRVGGGTSVNSIPSEAWMEVDLRSESPERLEALTETFLEAMHLAAGDENAQRSAAQGLIQVEIDRMGSRPAGRTAADSPVVQTAAAATWAVMDAPPVFVSSSTDANLPMSLGVPAITIDSGLPGGRAHAPDEWIDVARETALPGLERALLLVVSLAGIR